MKSTFLQFAVIALVFGCAPKEQEPEEDQQNSIIGTWELLSETKIQGNDTTYTEAAKDKRMIKIINQTHFAFLNHDLKQGKDSVKVFVAGGGNYTLKDGDYKEHLEYCNFREWENNIFDFKVEIKNDTLIQQGVEKVEGIGVDRFIIEKYVRLKE
jgi:hypothetical protein